MERKKASILMDAFGVYRPLNEQSIRISESTEKKHKQRMKDPKGIPGKPSKHLCFDGKGGVTKRKKAPILMGAFGV